MGVKDDSNALAAQLRSGGDSAAHTFNDSNYGDVEDNGWPAWQNGVNKAVSNPDATVSITLDGMPGTTPEEQFQNAYIRGVEVGQKGGLEPGNGTAWEMSRVGASAYASTFDPEIATGRAWSTFNFYTMGEDGAYAPIDVAEPNWAELRQLAGQ